MTVPEQSVQFFNMAHGDFTAYAIRPVTAVQQRWTTYERDATILERGDPVTGGDPATVQVVTIHRPR